MLTNLDYKEILESAPDGLLIVSERGQIVLANPMAERMFGWDSGTLAGATVEELLPDEVRSDHVGLRDGYARSPHLRPMGAGLDLRAQRKDGTTFPVQVSLSPWSSEKGQFVLCCVRDITELERLQSFSDRALMASEEERLRIAQELHDDTAQRLATLILSVGALARQDDPDDRAQLFDGVRQEIVDVTDSVRRLARGLRPPELDELGLAHALAAFGRTTSRTEGFRVLTDVEPVDGLSQTEALVLYRVVQEAVTNTRRHSGADLARVSLRRDGNSVVAEVSDEGRGFLPRTDDGGLNGLGLVGMSERAALVGARLGIDSEPGRGTRVSIVLPLQNGDEG